MLANQYRENGQSLFEMKRGDYERVFGLVGGELLIVRFMVVEERWGGILEFLRAVVSLFVEILIGRKGQSNYFWG